MGWWETLKAIDIKNRAKSLQNHNYIFDHDEDPRIPEQTKSNLKRIRREKINDLMRQGLILMRSVGLKEAG